MFSLALKLVLRRIDASAILVLMLAPTVVLLVGTSVVAGGFATQAQTVASLLPSGEQRFTAYSNNSSSPSASVIDFSVYTRLRDVNGVQWALPFLALNGTTSSRANDLMQVSIIGTNITELISVKNAELTGALANSSSEVDVGAISAKVLALSIGVNVTLNVAGEERTFRVAGIVNSSSQYDVAILLPLEYAWQIWPGYAGTLSYVEFSLSPDATQESLGSIRALTSGGLYMVSEQGLAPTISSFANQVSGLIGIWTAVLLVLSAVIAVSASFRILSVAGEEFRVSRVIGAKTSTAKSLVFYELLIVSAVSVAAGIGGGVVAADIFSAFLHALSGVSLTPLVDPIRIGLLALASLCFMIGAGGGTLFLIFGRASKNLISYSS